MENKKYNIDDLTDIVRKLRAPDGCPWDKVQTHESIKKCLIDECYELIEALDSNDPVNMKEELGDVLLQVVFHSIIEEENDRFTFDEVVDTVAKKMIHRHPHVFGSREGLEKKDWNELKKEEKKEQRKELEKFVEEGKADKKLLEKYDKMLQD